MVELTPFEARKLLKEAPHEKRFKLHMGTEIKNLEELEEALELMTEKSYSHHITTKKNDFAKWVKEVIADEKLSKDLVKAKDRKDSHSKLRRRIIQLRLKAREGRPLSAHEWMKYGQTDFLLGIVIGFVVGLIVAIVL